MADDPVGSSASTHDQRSGESCTAAEAVVVRVDSQGVVKSVEGDGRLSGVAREVVRRALKAELASVVSGPGVEGGRAEVFEGGLGVWIEVRVWPAGDGDGVVAVCQDVTRRRELDEECERLRAESARWRSASGARDQFMAVLSHELRTPLTPVLMAAGLLERDAALPPSAREEAAVIRRNVELEARLIDDLLDLNRITLGKLSLSLQGGVDVHGAIGHALHVAREDVVAKRIWLRMDLRATRQGVRADPVRLQQVFWNLIKNAVKFTPEGGTLIVRSRDGDGVVRVEVQDTGMGIESSALARIFEAFEQAGKPAVEGGSATLGLGLGLAICKSLVEMHGGRIWAESAGAGRGATFVVELPLAEAGVAGGAAPGDGAAGSDGRAAEIGRRLAILVVEDHAGTASMLAKVLRGFGHEVATVGSVGEAKGATAGRRYDLLISDLGLPDGSGTEVMERLRREDPAAKGIAISGYGMEEDLRRSAAAGFAAHLIKPVAVKQLKDVIERVTRDGGHGG